MSSREMENWGIGTPDPDDLLKKMQDAANNGDQNSFWFFCYCFRDSVERKFYRDREIPNLVGSTCGEMLSNYELSVLGVA